jgi:spore germination protein KC
MRRCLPLFLILCVLLSGCWDYKDLNKLSIVAGMAFDRDEYGNLKVLAEIIDRSSSPKKEGLRTRVVEATGRDMDEAEKALSKGLDFELYYGAMAVVIFSGDAPAEDLRKWLLNNREVRETVYIINSDDAGELLQTEEDGGIASYKLRDIMEASKDEKPLQLYLAEGKQR